MLRVVRIRLARCTLSPFQASRLLPQRRYNREQQRESSSNSKRLRQPRLSRAPARVQNRVPPCLATSLRRISNARTRCRIRTDRVVLRMERRRGDRPALDLEDPVWPLMRRGIRRLPVRRRGHRCRDSLRRCAWASLVSAHDHRDEVGRDLRWSDG